jgi:hypothetical protein
MAGRICTNNVMIVGEVMVGQNRRGVCEIVLEGLQRGGLHYTVHLQVLFGLLSIESIARDLLRSPWVALAQLFLASFCSG